MKISDTDSCVKCLASFPPSQSPGYATDDGSWPIHIINVFIMLYLEYPWQNKILPGKTVLIYVNL